MKRFENDRKWGLPASLYGYVQQYFAWLDGRKQTQFDIYPYDGALFDPDPILDDPALKIDDTLFCGLLKRLARESMGRTIDYSQINPPHLGEHLRAIPRIRDRDQGGADRSTGRPRHAAQAGQLLHARVGHQVLWSRRASSGR